MPTELTFGGRLRQLRKVRGLDQRTLAGRVEARLRAEESTSRGFDFTYLSKIENGRVAPPSAAVIIGLAKELDADPDELFDLAGKVSPDLDRTLRESAGARLFYRTARQFGFSEQDWRDWIEELRSRGGRR